MAPQTRMLKIGEFSRLSQVTVKTLHHYNDLGLLRPTFVDPSTSYRYYTLDQLPVIHRIMALKEMGLSLDQIGQMLTEEISTEEIRGMLSFKRAEIRERLQEEEKRLAMVDFRLQMIDAEANFPDLDVVIKPIETFPALTFFVEPHHRMEPAIEQIKNAIRDREIDFEGAVIDVFHGDEVVRQDDIAHARGRHEGLIRVGTAQAGDVMLDAIGTLRLQWTTPLKSAAVMVLHGLSRDERFERAALLRRWAVAHGYRLMNELRYVHHRGPLETSNRHEWITEIQLSVDTREGQT